MYIIDYALLGLAVLGFTVAAVFLLLAILTLLNVDIVLTIIAVFVLIIIMLVAGATLFYD